MTDALKRVSIYLLFCVSFFCFDVQSRPLPPIASGMNEAEYQSLLATYSEREAVISELLNSAGLEHAGYINGLISEASPYLLRHAVNPINWVGHNQKQFDAAQKANKLIFLSIGYSTCHWCHVMEKESFVDHEVARYLNQHFVNIKVDREIHSDVDQFYANALTLVKGSAGWPISAVLTPKGDLIWIDSYLPKDKLLKTFKRLHRIWQVQPTTLEQIAKNLALQIESQYQFDEIKWERDAPTKAIESVAKQLDPIHGGLQGAPKFPSAALLLALLDDYAQSPTSEKEKAITLWLDSLMRKGLRDHIHGGFFRYATDDKWHIPHFEKMLYNQALLTQCFARAARYFNNPDYLQVAKSTLEFSERKMQSERGGFYSAIDADYQGKEGHYYLFSEQSKNKVTSSQVHWLQFKDEPLWFPTLRKGAFGRIENKNLQQEKMQLTLPHIDKKVITSWNALMILAYVEMYSATSNTQFLDKAVALSEFINTHLYDNNSELKRVYYLEQAQGAALLEDYVYLAEAMKALYRVTNSNTWLSRFKSLLKGALLGFEQRDKKSLQYKYITDGEFISPHALFTEQLAFARQLDVQFLKPAKAHKIALQQAFLRNSSGAFSAITSLDSKTNVASEHVFARGNGYVSLLRNSNGWRLSFKLAPGWHINSNKPLQKSLIATSLSVADSQLDAVSYPDAISRMLGFDDKPLNLYEGEFNIDFDLPKESQNRFIDLKVQACSDSVCLLPETLRFSFLLD